MQGHVLQFSFPSEQLEDPDMRANAGPMPAKAMILAVFLKFLAAQYFAVNFQEGHSQKSRHGDADVGGLFQL
jgi:hypothetical protein